MPDTQKPGDTVDYVVTYLEMTSRPTAPAPPRPVNLQTALLAAQNPPVEYFLYLYTTVGGDHEWTDWLTRPHDEVEAFVGHSDVLLYSLVVDGWPGGFFMLDSRVAGTCDLAYFGLVPQAVGRGLGRWFLATAIETGWSQSGTDKMTVNTNTLDHPRALGLYQKAGFHPVRRERATRRLTRERTE